MRLTQARFGIITGMKGLAAILMIPCAVFGGQATIDFFAWDGSSAFPDGWTGSKVRKSSPTGDYKGGLWFNGIDYWLRSPQFGFAIETVEVHLSYGVGDGKVPTRVLEMRPIVDGEESGPVAFGIPSLRQNYEMKSIDLSAFETDEFVIRLEGSGSDGNWYVGGITVNYDETRPIVHSVESEPESVSGRVLSNCWKMSEFAKSGGGQVFRAADFSLVETVKARTGWINGESVDSIYVFNSGGAVSNIYPSTYKSSPNGLYAALTNEGEKAIHALALQATDRERMELLLPIALDAGTRVDQVSVSFRGWEPKVGAASKTTLAFHWCALDSLDLMVDEEWIAASDGDFSGGGLGPWRMVRIPGKSLGAAKFVCFRWSVRNQANSSLLGISDLRVTANVRRAGLSLQVR